MFRRNLIPLVIASLAALVASLARAAPPDPQLIEQELSRLRGEWVVIAFQNDRIVVSGEKAKAANIHVVIRGNKMIRTKDGQTLDEATLQIDPTAHPKVLDTTDKNGVMELGIYHLEGDLLTLCTTTEREVKRPAGFAPSAGQVLFWLRRERP